VRLAEKDGLTLFAEANYRQREQSRRSGSEFLLGLSFDF
jgi:hypothetical protein